MLFLLLVFCSHIFFCFTFVGIRTIWCSITFNANGMFCHWTFNYHWIRNFWNHRHRQFHLSVSYFKRIRFYCIANGLVHRRFRRLLSFQFMLCPCTDAWVRTCSFHVSHRFCFYSLFVFSCSFSSIIWVKKMHLHFVVILLFWLHCCICITITQHLFCFNSKFILVIRTDPGYTLQHSV